MLDRESFDMLVGKKNALTEGVGCMAVLGRSLLVRHGNMNDCHIISGAYCSVQDGDYESS